MAQANLAADEGELTFGGRSVIAGPDGEARPAGDPAPPAQEGLPSR